MIYRFNKLLEQELEAGRGIKSYARTISELFGVEQLSNGKKRFNPARKDIDAASINLQELAFTFLGPDYKKTLMEQWYPGLTAYWLLESGSGAPVTASHFANISGLVTTVVGLLDALVWENYNNPTFVGLDIVTVRERRVEGGKIIGARADTDLSTSGLARGEELPTFGLHEVWVNVPESKRYGGRVLIDQFVFIYDRTDQVVDAAAKVGTKIAHDIEKAIATAVLGVDNTYVMNDVSTNFYRTSAGAFPFNYINQLANPLNDWTAVNNARQVLEGNRDLSNLPITLPEATVYVMPQEELKARTILRATEILTGSQPAGGVNFPLSIRRSENPVGGFAMKPLNRVWYNVLREAGLNDAQASGMWLYGNVARSHLWAQIMPLTTATAPLAGADLARGIALDYQAQACGAVVPVDPRYVCKCTIS